MILKTPAIQFKPVTRISPSQFHSWSECNYRMVLSAAFLGKPLMALPAASYFGTVLHKVMEGINRKEIMNLEAFENAFDLEVRSMEQSLLDDGFNTLVPLQNNVADYGLKKVQLAGYLERTPGGGRSTWRPLPEKWLESPDKKAGGWVDLVWENGKEVEIVDLKTGVLVEDEMSGAEQEVKQRHQNQLKIYAWLYYLMKGVFPSTLAVIDLRGNKITIPFTFEECKEIFNGAIELLDDTNDRIASGVYEANPTIENCKYCRFRPVCKFYLDTVVNDPNTNDSSGIVLETRQYNNGIVSVTLDMNGRMAIVTGIPSTLHGAMEERKGTMLGFFNLKREQREQVYFYKRSSVIYEY